MSTLIPQQFVEAQNASVQQMFAFSNTAFEGIEKLTALNLQVVKATLAENQALLMKMLSAKPEELVTLSTSLAKPAAEKLAAYNRHVFAILSGVQGDLSSTAQSQLQQHQSDAHAFVESLTTNAPLVPNVVVTE
ncbi:phasin family protein [Paraburkholderia strydomiana]|jgi:phasin family protein|uniref:phasin family protein n=1 Tax=Paraburkholderia strydomiana TaxID=1245417 RepID=UPI0038BE1C7E